MFHPGDNVTLGKDYTISAATVGRVRFEKRKVNLRKYHYDRNLRHDVVKQFVSVEPFTVETQPTPREIERMGLNPVDVQKQIHLSELSLVKKWTNIYQDEFAKLDAKRAKQERAAKQIAIAQVAKSRKEEKFLKYLEEVCPFFLFCFFPLPFSYYNITAAGKARNKEARKYIANSERPINYKPSECTNEPYKITLFFLFFLLIVGKYCSTKTKKKKKNLSC